MEVFDQGSAEKRNFECGDLSRDIIRLMLQVPPEEGKPPYVKEGRLTAYP